MTHPALTAEQRAARIERDIAACRRFAAVYRQAAIDYDQSAKRELARIAELEQLLADLDSKQVTPRQIERVPSAHESNSKAWDLTQEAAKLDTADLSQEQIERYPVLSHAPCPYCNSPLKVSDERYPARKLSEAELAELDELANEEAADLAGETLLTVPMGGEVGK